MRSHVLLPLRWARDTDLGVIPHPIDVRKYGPSGRSRPEKVVGVCSCKWRSAPYPPSIEPGSLIVTEHRRHVASARRSA